MDLTQLRLSPQQYVEANNILLGINSPDRYESVREWASACYSEPKAYELKLYAIDIIMNESGVESLVEDGKHLASYVNTGDTYSPTVLYDI